MGLSGGKLLVWSLAREPLESEGNCTEEGSRKMKHKRKNKGSDYQTASCGPRLYVIA